MLSRMLSDLYEYHRLLTYAVIKFSQLTLEQLGKLSHKLPNYTMVNYDFLKGHIQQIDENYQYPMPT